MSRYRLRVCDNLISETGGTLLADMLEKNGSLHFLDIRCAVEPCLSGQYLTAVESCSLSRTLNYW